MATLRAADKESVPWRLYAKPWRSARRERQHRVEAVQRLHGGCLIDREHDRIRRRGEIQADDVGGLGLDVGIITREVAFEPMRLEARARPHPGDGHMAAPKQRRHATRGPVRQRRRRGRVGRGETLRFDAGIQTIRTATAGAIAQGEEAFLHHAALPRRDERVRHAVGRTDHRGRLAIGQREDHAGAADQSRPHGRRPPQAGQNPPVIRRQLKCHRRRHHASGERTMHAFHIAVTVH